MRLRRQDGGLLPDAGRLVQATGRGQTVALGLQVGRLLLLAAFGRLAELAVQITRLVLAGFPRTGGFRRGR